MKFIDLAAQQERIRGDIEARMAAVLRHGQYIMGPEVAELEKELSAFTGVKHAVSCASGTDALLLPLMAWGVGPGDAVFTTPFTFIATAEVIALLGATPVFVDIDPETFNMDPDALSRAVLALAEKNPAHHPLPANCAGLTPKAVIPVDLFGLPADYEAVNGIARRHGLRVLEDAAQGFGGTAKGQKTCSLAEVGATSFFPAKPLGAYGDGGAVFTGDDDLAAIMRSIRVHGQGGHRYDNVRVGMNGRLDTLQAAVLLAKMKIFPEELRLRDAAASRYARLLAGGPVVTPAVPPGFTSAWAQYSVLAESEAARTALMERLKGEGIPTAIYYPLPLHLQGAFKGLGYRPGDFPASESAAKRIFSLPMHPYLAPEDQERIAKVIKG